MTLTDLEKKYYLRSKGTQCPYCGGEDIWGDDLDFTPGCISQEMYCSDCDEMWYDEYTLTGVEERE